LSLILIALGGAAGAVSRFVLDTWLSSRLNTPFPWGTFVVNVSGSFVLGLLFALAIERDVLPTTIRLPILVGFIGAYTTFSTLMLESWRLVEGGAYLIAVANIFGSVAVGVIALAVGLAAGRTIA
jgi:CrcB protein